MADVRAVDANELLKESIYCREEDGSNVYAVPVGKIFSAPTLKLDKEPRQKAHWIVVGEVNDKTALKCSACGNTHVRIRTAFCCDCGAEMGGPENG